MRTGVMNHKLAVASAKKPFLLSNNDAIEPSLLLKNETRLDIPLANPSFEFLTFFEYKIKADPNNLKPYIQRIFLCRHTVLNKFLAGSLADLFIELNTKGVELKKRMLAICRPLLKEHELSVFLRLLKKPEQSPPPLQLNHSIHASQLLGDTTIINKAQHKETETQESIIDLANAYIEHGQLEDAIELLTEQVLADPQNNAVGEALTEILIASKDKSHFNKTLLALKQSATSLPECWKTTEAILLEC